MEASSRPQERPILRYPANLDTPLSARPLLARRHPVTGKKDPSTHESRAAAREAAEAAAAAASEAPAEEDENIYDVDPPLPEGWQARQADKGLFFLSPEGATSWKRV